MSNVFLCVRKHAAESILVLAVCVHVCLCVNSWIWLKSWADVCSWHVDVCLQVHSVLHFTHKRVSLCRHTHMHTHKQGQGKCMQNIRPHTQTHWEERRGKSRCVCVTCSVNLAWLTVCVMCRCLLLPHYYNLHMLFFSLIVDLPLVEKKDV